MKIALPNGGTYDGVKLLTAMDTPFPDNSIHPVLNFDVLLLVPEQYRIVDNGAVREMTQDEKDVVDLAGIENLRSLAISQIEAKNQILAEQGFTFNTKQFSLSLFDTTIWVGMEVRNLMSGLTFPQSIETLDRESFSIPDASTYHLFFGAGLQRWKAIFDSSHALKAAVKEAIAVSTIKQAMKDNDART